MSTIGIYAIRNKINGKVYIGSSADIHHRWVSHRSGLNNNKHHAKHLQYSWNKNGEDAFSFEILETCDLDKLVEREQYHIDLNKAVDNDHGYNTCPAAGSTLGLKASKETKEKLSKFHKERYKDENNRKKTKELTKAATNTKEYKEMCSNRSKRLWADEDFRTKQKEAMVGSISDEQREAQAERMRERFSDEAYRNRVALAIPHRKRVRCKETGTIYNSISAAAKATDVSITSIRDDINGRLSDVKTVRRKATFELVSDE